MKSSKPAQLILLAVILAAAFVAVSISPAQAQCGVPGAPACPPREKKTRTPTRLPPTKTPTPTPTPAGIPLTGGDGGGAAPDAIPGSPAIQLTAFSNSSFLIGLLILVLLLVGGGFVTRFVLRRDAEKPNGTGELQKPNHVSTMDYSLQQPGVTGEGEIHGNDSILSLGAHQQLPVGRNDGIMQQVDRSPGATGHELAHTAQNSPADHDGLNNTWESNGNIDLNTDGSNLADQGDSSSSMPKPPDSD